MFNLFKKEKEINLMSIRRTLDLRNWNIKESSESEVVIEVDYFNTYKRLRNNLRQKYSLLTLRTNKGYIDIVDEDGYVISTVSEQNIFSEIMDICNIVSDRNFSVAINNRARVSA